MSKPGFCSLIEMLSYELIEKDCDFSFHMIYILYLHAISIESYADKEQTVVVNLCKITEPRK